MKQLGYGVPVYTGAAYQRGYGLGHTLKNIVRSATPLLKHAGKEALKTGISTLVRGALGTSKRKQKRPKRTIKRKIIVAKKPVVIRTKKRKVSRNGNKKITKKMVGDIFNNK